MQNIPTHLPSRELLAQVARLSVGGLISVDHAARHLSLPRHEVALRLARFAKQGWLTRAQRGLYLLRPLEAGATSGIAIEDPWLLAHQLFAPCYIGGWSAAEHAGLTEQLFRSTFVVSAAPGRRRRIETVLGSEFRVVRVPLGRVEGVGETWRGHERVRVSDPERTLADALVDPSWVGGVRHLAEMLTAYRESAAFRPLTLLHHLESLGRTSGAGFKRLGFLAETLWPDQQELLARAHEHLSQGLSKLDPTIASSGPIRKRWRLRINVALT